MLAVPSGEQPMHVCCERQAESPQRDRRGRVASRGTRRTAKPIVLVPNVGPTPRASVASHVTPSLTGPALVPVQEPAPEPYADQRSSSLDGC